MKTIILAFAVTAMLGSAALAAGTESEATTAAPAADFSAIKAKLDKNEYKAAIDDLTEMSKTVQSADLFNYLGYASRKDGQLQSAAFYYEKALSLDANHKGAVSYQGQLFIALGDKAKAEANLTKLAGLCPDGCEERTELEKALAQ
jgi:Flp pilus assembly protein TadD